MNNQEKNHPLKPIKQLLSESWRLYVVKLLDFVEMYLWGLLGLLPLLLVGLLAAFVFAGLQVNSWLFYILFGLIGLAALIWAIYYGTRAKIGLILILKNDNSGVKNNFRQSKDFFAPYFIISILLGILIFLGFILLIIPGVFLAVIWSLAVLLVVLEDKRSFKEATRRSYALVKNFFWPVFRRFLLLGVIAFFVSLIMNIPMSSLNETGKQAYSLVLNVFWALLSPFILTYTYLIYKDLVSKK